MSIYFDSGDRALLEEVRRVRQSPVEDLPALLHPQLHPQGIQELSAHRAVRVAGAVAALLESLSRAQSAVRLQALRVLREEALTGGNPALRLNTGRVLVQLMKELVRATGDEARQLELARDFRSALSGKPGLIRSLLRRYHLLEMPEDCAPATFDDHVHDASTKGRKTPAHLLLDAWIKGITSLTVVYYNHLPPEAGGELLAAAEILGMSARAGVEFPALFHGNLLNLLWVPEGVYTPQALRNVLSIPAVGELMRLGREVSSFRGSQLGHFLNILNAEMLPALERDFGVTMPHLQPEGLAEVVADGQPSLLHLAEYVDALLQPLLRQKMSVLREQGREDDVLFLRWREFGPEMIKAHYLKPLSDRYIGRHSLPPGVGELPLLLREGVADLVARLRDCGCAFRLSLSSAHLHSWDLPEVLNLADGAISGLEIFNLKDYLNRSSYDTAPLNRLRLALNNADITGLKGLMTELAEQLRDANPPFCGERLEALRQVRRNIGGLLALYAGRPLEAVVGSDSAGRSRHLYGMGIAVVDTLPASARRQVRKERIERLILPVRCRFAQSRLIPCSPERDASSASSAAFAASMATGVPIAVEPQAVSWPERCMHAFRRLGRALFAPLGRQPGEVRSWRIEDRAAGLVRPGNLVTLGGLRALEDANDMPQGKGAFRTLLWRWNNLNTGLRNPLKVLAGFLPAFLTFYLTRDWWVLAWGGALVWFGITGGRNVVQAVLGGGGLHRSHLLRWRTFLDTSRIADSLFFTGLSVPLLDLFTRQLLLSGALGMNSASHPLTVFATISLVNGCYIASHNYYRGLPRAAVIGNLFRSVLAIGPAMAANAGLESLAGLLGGGAGALALLANCSAIVAKFSSDGVACVIEGLAERSKHLRQRREDWRSVLRRFFAAVEAIELAFPEEDGRTVLENRAQFLDRFRQPGTLSSPGSGRQGRQAGNALFAAALDMLYFWYCQPRARLVFAEAWKKLTPVQQQELRAGLNLLQEERTVEDLLREGLAGRNEQPALNFYRENYRSFLAALPGGA